MSAIMERIQNHSANILAGEHQVSPGTPAEFTEAASLGDGIWQGDLGLEVVAEVPDGYVKITKPTLADRQLVPGNTEGARHCLDSLKGVTIYRPKTWDEESLQGPCIVLTERRTVLHPKHGAVTIPAGFTILCRYQREWDKEQKKELRTRD